MRIQAFALMVGILAACSSSEAGRPGGDVGSGGDATGASPDAGADARTDATDATGATEVGLGSDVVGVAGEDEDFDGIDDGVDNCPGLFNPKQEDIDQDDLGDACDATIDDRDRDNVPDVADPFPDDAQRPGVVNAATVYAHTASELYFLEVKTGDVFLVDDFHWPADASSREMTDIAIDRFGVLYGISFSDVFVIHPQTAQCWRLAALPQQFNGLTHISRTLSGTANDALVGISNDGGWWRLALVPTVPPSSQQRVELTFFGGYGSGWTSSGDAFSIEGVGTFASVDTSADDQDFLVRVDPTTGAVAGSIGAIGNFDSVYGLAGWKDKAFAFDASGEVMVIDLASGQILSRKDTGHVWWGAGVRTILDE